MIAANEAASRIAHEEVDVLTSRVYGQGLGGIV